MSQGQAVPHKGAWTVAVGLLEDLGPGCERIEIAGSLRRGKAEVHDIELVAVARTEERPDGLFGTQTVDLLDERLGVLMAEACIHPRRVESHRADGSVEHQTKLGPAFKALVSPTGIPVDLFIVRPPATWGCIYALRTGPGAWNTELVTRCKDIGRRVAGGQVERWDGGTWTVVPTPEEADFFAALGQPWVEPRDRAPGRVRIQRSLAVPAA